MIIACVLITIGFAVLIKGADLLVDGASSIARQLRVSDLVLGLTVVAFGTSSPELFVNIIASIKGSPGIAVGNIVGSTIANIFLVLGIASIIYPLIVTKSMVWREIPLGLFASVLLGFLAYDALLGRSHLSVLSRIDAGILLFFFIVFLIYSLWTAKRTNVESNQLPRKQLGLTVSIVFIVVGFVGLSVGGKWIVDGAQDIARALGVSDTIIGLTIVAIGTCLPELATASIAAFKKNPEIAVSSIVGSNIFNLFFVFGVSALLQPLAFTEQGVIDVLVMVVATLLLFIAMFTGRKRLLERWQGIIFVCAYISYIVYLILQEVV